MVDYVVSRWWGAIRDDEWGFWGCVIGQCAACFNLFGHEQGDVGVEVELLIKLARRGVNIGVCRL